ncbi:MAG TPA: ATP-binding cassette domain-containing protein, partial [Ktedonobacteraceae bacterium]|nr:ATP-binding cassette domain-containing protein [Ktedonobacteraceae bacterium]
EIQQGVVRIDGTDNRAYPLNILRQNVSMVLQDSVLFEGTVAENISIGKPGAPLYEVIEAAKKANIHETIINDLGGYDGSIREQGKNLSGGQRQRMAIARAILRDAPILILDEPTAALDVESEAEVMHALEKLIVGRTVIMISHRLSTLGNVEEIIVLKNGQIAEQGSFQDLKRRGGVFAALLAEQNRYNLEKAGDKSILRSAFVAYPDVFDQRQAQQAPGRPAAFPATPVPPVGQNWPLPQVWPSGQQAPIPAVPVQGNWGGNGQQQQQQQMAVPVAPRKARVLIEVDGKVVGERDLNKPSLTVGRLSGNDVQVPSQRVSRLHARIHEENGTWVIEDAESLNGMIYRGQRVDRLVLNNGDRIYVAPTAVLQFATS